MLKSNSVMIMGGQRRHQSVSTVEILDLTSELFRPAPSMLSPRSYHSSCVLPNGNVFVTGGCHFENGTLSILDSCEEYDLTSASWQPRPHMIHRRYAHACVFLTATGEILVIGGSPEHPTSCEIYNIHTQQWSIGSPVDDRFNAAVAAF
jgi:hypothetical protein